MNARSKLLGIVCHSRQTYMQTLPSLGQCLPTSQFAGNLIALLYSCVSFIPGLALRQAAPRPDYTCISNSMVTLHLVGSCPLAVVSGLGARRSANISRARHGGASGREQSCMLAHSNLRSLAQVQLLRSYVSRCVVLV